MEYYEIEPEDNTFKTIMADVTHKCHMECANCYIPNRDIPDMDADDLMLFLSRLPSRTDIRLIGAESTTRKDLPDLIRGVRKMGHRPSILTHGLKLANRKYTQTLHDAGLRALGLSMNGGGDDEVYKIMDNMPCAKRKTQALNNCMDVGLIPHVNCIIAKGVNEHMIGDLPKLVTQTALDNNKRFSSAKYPVMVRFKNIGSIGRYIDNSTLPMSELAQLCEDQLGVDKDYIMSQNMVDGYDECTSAIFEVETEAGQLKIKLTDWKVDEYGVPDPHSKRRGRITRDWTIAPFFEHVKQNEGGY